MNIDIVCYTGVPVTRTKSINFPQLLQNQKTKSWQLFVDRIEGLGSGLDVGLGNSADDSRKENIISILSEQQLADFQQALMLSDFVLNSALQAPELVIELFSSGQVYLEETPDYEGMLNAWLVDCDSEQALHRILRRFRLREMVCIAVADLVLDISLEKSLKRLSKLADVLIIEALNWLTKLCQDKWGRPQNSQGDEQMLLVFGMGKLGGKELNFSSDIDLIFSYPEAGETVGTRRAIDNQQFFTRLGQKLISALHQKTVDGFVYRVDMRLRPFGESGPLALTFSAMENYYQDQGRDWERYAMLKARLIGNSKYHQELTDMLRPFVYRRYIDFSVIDSLRRMKMMISQEVRRKQLVNNIKLGAGGIREIEFIVQVFQIIRGGRVKTLQQRHVLTVLPILFSIGELDKCSLDVLSDAYRFLRRVENIIQAFADEQTQTLPDNELDKQRLISVLNFKNWSEFLSCLDLHMSNVHQEFSKLIGEESPNHQAQDEHWQSLWLNQWPDEESIAWIEQYADCWQASQIWEILSSFRQELSKRSIGNRGRQVLDKLVPLLLWHLHDMQVEEVVLARVQSVLAKIMTRTAYIELLFENEGALKHLIKLCRASSWLTEHLAKYPILLDELIDPELLNNPPALSSYELELREIMLRVPEDDMEAQMDRLRQFKQAQQLRIAASDIAGVLPLMQVSDHLTALAEAIVAEVINLAWQQISLRFGVPESTIGNDHKGFAVIGYGKLGGIELGYGSDLDLVFLHTSKVDEVTNGERQISAFQFYSKLAQRILHIFNTRMSSGILYELDMRLRPSGNSGLLVVHVDTFAFYQQEDAWTWEHQALVRARAIYGHQAFRERFEEIRRNILSITRDHNNLLSDVIEMREKMRVHLDASSDEFSDIKQGVGGLVDIEFLAQFLVLKYNAAQAEISIDSDNISLFKQLNKFGFIDDFQQKTLIDGYCQLRDLGHKATLQNEKLMLPKAEFSVYGESINEICQRLMKND